MFVVTTSALPAGALARGGGVTLDTALPYTVLRRDVYRPFVDAFRRATARVPRAALRAVLRQPRARVHAGRVRGGARGPDDGGARGRQLDGVRSQLAGAGGA